MGFLETLQGSAFAMWVAGGDTLLAYPTILMLHTLGLAIVVGTNTVIALRVLGVSPGLPLDELKKTYRPMWIGFVINLVSGLCLFAANATHFGTMFDFYLKLSLIVLALVIAVRIRLLVFAVPNVSPAQIPQQAKVLAAISLALWTGAIVAGRLMAYINT